MDYGAALASPLQHPKWALNILLLAVCFLIPLVGPVVVTGYLLRCFRAWHNGEPYPEFDFQFFVEYLMNGLWPILVCLVIYMVMVPFLMVFVFGCIFLVAFVAEAGEGNGGELLAIIVLAFCVLLFALFYLFAMAVMAPPMLKSGIEQDFAAGFSWVFFKDFISRVGGTLLVADILILLASIPFMLVGYLALFVGIYFTMSWLMFSTWHVYHQLYRLYLSRGGIELVFSPKLEKCPESMRARPPGGPPPIPGSVPPLP